MLHGARELLTSERAPLVVFEAQAELFGAAEVRYEEILEFLGRCGCMVWSLQRNGLRPEPAGSTEPGSMNVLATRPDLGSHQAVVQRLEHTRFRQNQNE